MKGKFAINPSDMTKGKMFLTMCMCAAVPLIFSVVFMGLYWNLFAIANDYNALAPAQFGDGNAFEACGGVTIVDGKPEATPSKWQTAFLLNSIVYTMMTVATILITLTPFLPMCFYMGACMHSCVGLAHLAAIIVAGVFRFSTEGERCAALSMQPVTTSGTTMADVGSMFAGMFISQCVLLCIVGCFKMCMFQTGMAVFAVSKMKSMMGM